MRVIINADDFGMAKSVNLAVIELAKIGTISSTTVMVNMPYWAEIDILLDCEFFGIGLHFNLTEGFPVSHKSMIPSLLNSNGGFYNLDDFRKKARIGHISRQEVLIELRAQYNRLYEKIGDRLTHIDSHQAIHKLSILSSVLHEFSSIRPNLGLRSPKHFFVLNNDNIVNPTIFNFGLFSIKRILSEYYFRWYQGKLMKRFRMPAGELLDISLQKISTLNKLSQIVLDNNVTFEISCHPATSTLDLPQTKLTDKRIQEYMILKSAEFREAVLKNELITFRDL